MVIILLIIIAALALLTYRLYREREDARRDAAVERMAVDNLLEAIRRGEGEAALRAWEKRDE